MTTQPPTSLDALIDNAADAMEIELNNTPDTPPEAAAPPVVTAPVPEPPAPPVQAQTPPTPTVAQAEQATPAPAPSNDYEALKAELAALKASIQAPVPPAPEAPAEPPPTPQELVELDTIINGLSQSFVQVEQTIANAENGKAQWSNHLSVLQSRLVDSFDDPAVDVAALRRDIKLAEKAVGQYDTFIQGKAQERASLIQNWRVQSTLRESTDRILKLTAFQERASQAENDRKLESEATNWRSAKWEPAKKAATEKVPENLRARFDAYVERLGKAHVHSRGEDGRFTNSIADPAAFVNGLVDDFLAVAREGAASYSAQKVAEIPNSPANGKAGTPAPPPTNAKPKTEAEFEAHMEALWANA